jgi:hypothetical protein
MSFNGSGTFVINSTGQPVVTGTVISSTAFNALTADLATGLSTTMTKDGQTTATANIPMGSFKFTGLGTGSATTDSANVSQVQSSYGTFLTASGTDTITATVSPSLTAYAVGQMFAFVAANTNTGAVTINISSLGAKSITKSGTTALIASDLTANYLYVIVYDGTQFQLVGVSSSTFATLTVTGVLTLSGSGIQLLSTGTGAWQPPAGTTGQRPGTPANGAMRWNSTLSQLEVYVGNSVWQAVASSAYAANYLVVAGGAGGGYGGGGGGAAGGLLTATSVSFTSGTAYTITVGAGGAGSTTAAALGTSGSNSVILGVATATGGGGGGSQTSGNGAAGGSGGGGGAQTNGTGGAGTSGQGYAGGNGVNNTFYGAGGGGGASAVGNNGSANGSLAGAGGAGAANLISGTSVTYAGGGGGGGNNTAGAGGSGGGGAGNTGAGTGVGGTINTGGGGGGGGWSTGSGGAGGSGVVIISYLGLQRGTGGTITTSGGYTIHTFTSSSTYNA